MVKENMFMAEARQMASECWCDPETSSIEMDVILGEAKAKRISYWMDVAAQNERNTCYYRELLEECGRIIGDQAYISDDGTVQDDVLYAKIPELVANNRFLFLSSLKAMVKSGAISKWDLAESENI
jgi:hypothetical protein